MDTDTTSASLYQALAWFDRNKKPATLGGAAVVIVGLIVWAVVYYQGVQEIKASEELSNVAASQLSGAPHRPDLAEAYLKVAAAYPNYPAGARAQMLAASALYVQGKFDVAKAQFQAFARDHHDSPLMGDALLGIAACLDAQGRTNEAAVAYKDLIDHHPAEAAVPQAKFALARLYAAQGKPELARNMYEDVERTDPYGSFGSEAGMRVEELQLQYPNLVPKAPAPANTPTFRIEKQ